MAEQYPSEQTVRVLSGTTDSASGHRYPTLLKEKWWIEDLEFKFLVERLLKYTLSEIQPYDNGSLSLGVRAGKIRDNAGDLYTYAGGTRSMTDSSTNYVYIYLVSGVLTLTHSTSAYPDPAVTPHFRIATVVTSGGDISSIVDDRGDCLWQFLS